MLGSGLVGCEGDSLEGGCVPPNILVVQYSSRCTQRLNRATIKGTASGDGARAQGRVLGAGERGGLPPGAGAWVT